MSFGLHSVAEYVGGRSYKDRGRNVRKHGLCLECLVTRFGKERRKLLRVLISKRGKGERGKERGRAMVVERGALLLVVTCAPLRRRACVRGRTTRH